VAAHIFVDTTNIFVGARHTAAQVEPGAPTTAVRLHYPNLFRLIEGHHQVASRVLAGSIVGPNEALWDFARRAGYETILLNLLAATEGTGKREQAVDEVLHLKIANCLLDHGMEQTLVLVTGDGHESTYGTSFPGQVERALRRGWSVEVWAWKLQLSNAYRSLAANTKVRLQYLDPHYGSLTFVKRGEFDVMGTKKSSNGRGAQRLVLPRPGA
jgi:NYN domain